MDKTKTEQHNAKDAEAMATLQVKTCELEDARVVAEQQNVTLQVRTSELEEARAILEARAQEVDEARKNENAGHNTHSNLCYRLTCLGPQHTLLLTIVR